MKVLLIKKTGTAWKNLLNASKQISKKWKGSSAVEEIRGQREKTCCMKF
jgi:hypothetical protein